MNEIRMLPSNDDYLTLGIARQNDISKYRLYRFIHENEFERIGKGTYSKKDVLVDDFFVISQKYTY